MFSKLSVDFHATKKSYWLNAYNSMPYGLTYVITPLLLFTVKPSAFYNKFADEIHLNLPVIKEGHVQGKHPSQVQPDTLEGRIYVNLEHEAVHRALEQIDEDISSFGRREENVVEAVLKKSNPEFVKPEKSLLQIVKDASLDDVFSAISFK